MSTDVDTTRTEPYLVDEGPESAICKDGAKMELDDEFGDDFEYNEELESILNAAESQIPPLIERANGGSEKTTEDAPNLQPEPEPMDIEEVIPLLSPFERFRRHGYLSVSDLVGTVWCEVQYDYRLRTLPYLPPARRPAVITSDKGKEIAVNKAKEEGRERIVKRGQTIHKRLEREIHPEEIVVTTESREDVWGLRFMNMLAAMEALITLGTCREVPVVGFVGGILVTGIIDELQRHSIKKDEKSRTRSSRQTALTSFFSPTKPRPISTVKTHKIYVSDSKTRARDSLPKEADTMAGQLQCMMYKELLDAMLLSSSGQEHDSGDSTNLRPSARPLTFDTVFQHLSLNPIEPFSDHFMAQTRLIVKGNDLRMGSANARNLQDMVRVWESYVCELGLGRSPTSDKAKDGDGRTETRLELVYRRAGPKKAAKLNPRKRKGGKGQVEGTEQVVEEVAQEQGTEIPEKGKDEEATRLEEDRPLRLAIAESLKSSSVGETSAAPFTTHPSSPRPKSRQSDYHVDRTSDEEREEDELALAVEMSLAAAQEDDAPGETSVSLSQRSEQVTVASTRSSSPTPPPGTGTASGSIIGRHRFQHDTELLEKHLSSVLQYWRGEREPIGVNVVNTSRCAWCEFEEGCEWRAKKAEEDWLRNRSRGLQL